MEKKEYYIGLDIGTNSVGWSVIDTNNKLLKFRGKNMWGVRLFEEGETAESRRIFRSTRRRFNRRRYRLQLLRQLFENEIYKNDDTFFIRLNESSKKTEDKKINNKYNLFIDKDFTDKEYYEKFPTIYHLRKYLIESNKKEDIRLIYLAIHHILKYRGNFLYENQNFDVNNIDIETELKEVLLSLEEIVIIDKINDQLLNNVSNILKNKTLAKKEKQDKLVDLFKNVFFDSKALTTFTRLILGMKTKTNNLFPYVEFDKEALSTLDLSFSDSKYDDKKDLIEEYLDDKFIVLEKIKNLYNSIVLSLLFSGVNTKYISDVMLKKYIDYKNDLIKITSILKVQNLETYNELFVEQKDKNGNNIIFIKKGKKYNHIDFVKKIKDLLTKIDNKDEIIKECLIDIEDEKFLPQITSVDNAIYPYQLNLIELEAIIRSQAKYYPFLSGTTENGKNKIVELLKFRIPYYVGPLNRNINNPDSFAWIVKNNKEKITPWNFDEVVNKEASAEIFIKRMTNYCSYLLDQTVIPKNSLLYSKYMVLNELKNIRVNNKKIPLELQKKIYKDLFLEKINVTKKDLEAWLIKNKYPDDNPEITGFSNEDKFLSNLKPYIDFRKIFGNIDKSNESLIETLIEWTTIYPEKDIIKVRIKKEFPNINDNQINQILRLKYTGWSRLSRKLLESELLVDNRTGEITSIINLLENTEDNFMQIITDKNYNFEEVINRENFKDLDYDIDYDDIKEIACSPAVKKGLWQSILIIKEIVEIIGNNPKHIFIETTREDKKKERSTSRDKQLIKLYNDLTDDIYLLDRDKKEYSRLKKEISQNQDKINQNRYFLYFLQRGKCLYSNRPLYLENIHEYEVDHIIPQSIIKDDSLDNLALVYKSENQRKSDGLTLNYNIINNQKEIWNNLLKYKFMEPKKYHNLIRNEFKEEDIEKFINRQIVETNQVIKHLLNLINKYMGENTAVGIKSKIITGFRQKYSLYKIRELNNLHHGLDAYLSATIGNYVLKRFPNMKKEYIYSQFIKRDKHKDHNIGHGFILDSMDKNFINENNEVIIDANEWLKNILKISSYQDMIVTKKTEVSTGEFYDQNAISPKQGLYPIKKNLDPIKYGGYAGRKEAYSMLIEYKKGKNTETKMIGIPIVIESQSNKDQNVLEDFIKKEIKVENYTIIRNKVKKNQLIHFKGQNCYLTASSEVCNAVELKIDKKYLYLLNIIIKNLPSAEEIEMFLNNSKELMEEIIKKMENHYPLFSSETEKIKKYVEENHFQMLNFEEQKKFFLEVLRILKANSENGNLSSYNNKDQKIFVDRMGRRSGQNVNKGFIIDSSVTGLYRKKYEF